MVRLKLAIELDYAITEPGCDFVFGIHATHTAQQQVVAEDLVLSHDVPVARLPGHVLSYVYPSRYCESDRLHRLAMREFGRQWQGYGRVQAIRDWVRQRAGPCLAKAS